MSAANGIVNKHHQWQRINHLAANHSQKNITHTHTDARIGKIPKIR